MKTLLRNVLIIMLAVTTAVCAAVGLAACGGAKLQGLKIENAKTEFKIGDEFEYGADFKVLAVYSDGTETDVTEEAQIKQEAGFDMNIAGDYQITVSWGGKKEVYTVYVSDFDNILRKIELDSTDFRKTYSLGEDVSFDGLKINCTYENAQGNLIERTVTSVKDFTVVISDETGYTVTDIYDKQGTYSITVSLGSISDSVTVDVSGVNIDTVQGAIFAGVAFKNKVVSGTHEVWSEQINKLKDNISYRPFIYNYEFGDNYTYINQIENSVQMEKYTETDKDGNDVEKRRYYEVVYHNNDYHYSIENTQIACVQLQDGKVIPNNGIQTGMIEGSPYMLWYNRVKVFGAENLLNMLYRAARECTNKDLKETADPVKREYSFSFSGVVFISNTEDYYETEVSFRLGEDYTVEYLEYIQECWQYNIGNANGNPPTFTTDANGFTTPNGNCSIKDKHCVTQTVGERTKKNPYSPEAIKVKSYDLMYNNQSLGDNGVIDCNVDSPKIVIEIANLFPETANVENDTMYFDYEGSTNGEVISNTVLYSEGFSAFRSGSTITVYVKNGGVWKLKIRTSGTYKTVTFNVTGVAPKTMTAQLGNKANGKCTPGNKKTVFAGTEIYFYCTVDKYANSAQSAAVTSGNSATAAIQKTTLGGIDCFVFKATAAGAYIVTVTSDAAPSVKCEFTFTVSAPPDYASLLSGKYSVQNVEGDIFELEFTLDGSAEGISGTVVVTRTPTDEDDNPLYDEKKTQTLSYSADVDNAKIMLTAVSGENLGITLSVNADGNLMMGDQFNYLYKLNRVAE